jgi:hypothetical protein
MEGNPQPLALPTPSTHAPHTHTAITVVEPTEQTALTTIPSYSPPTDLENLLASIPAPVHIQNVQFSVQ